MKIAVSVPDDVFHEAESAAERLGLNRSQLYARALAAFVAAQGDDPVTERLTELASEQPQGSGASVARQLIDAGSWEW